MTTEATECAHCQVPISEPRTTVSRAGRCYCCPNCAAAMDHDSRAQAAPDGRRCAHCGVQIVDRSTMATRVDQAFCCPNCMNGAESIGDATDPA